MKTVKELQVIMVVKWNHNY